MLSSRKVSRRGCSSDYRTRAIFYKSCGAYRNIPFTSRDNSQLLETIERIKLIFFERKKTNWFAFR